MEHPTVSVFLSCLLLLFSAMGTSFAEPNPMDQPRGANIARHPPGMISEESEGVEYKSFAGETGRLRVFDSPYGRILAGSEVPERESAGLAAESAQTRASTTLAQAKGAAKEQNEGEAKPLSEPGRSVTDAGLGKDKKLTHKGEPDKVELNFEDADLSEVIRTLANLLQLNYIVDPNVKGKVTMYTAGTLKKKDLLSIFLQILQVNGLTAIKEGQLYRIVEAKDASRMPIAILKGQNQENVPPEERIIIQIVPLKSISVQEMTKLITPFVSAAGTIVSSETTNTFIVVDKAYNILKILKLVEVFDVDVFGEITYSFYKVEYTDVDGLAKTLSALFPSLRGAREPSVRFIALDRLNTLLTISSNPRALSKVEEFIRKLDVPSEEVAPPGLCLFS